MPENSDLFTNLFYYLWHPTYVGEGEKTSIFSPLIQIHTSCRNTLFTNVNQMKDTTDLSHISLTNMELLLAVTAGRYKHSKYHILHPIAQYECIFKIFNAKHLWRKKNICNIYIIQTVFITMLQWSNKVFTNPFFLTYHHWPDRTDTCVVLLWFFSEAILLVIVAINIQLLFVIFLNFHP